jgi:hypothetical protein
MTTFATQSENMELKALIRDAYNEMVSQDHVYVQTDKVLSRLKEVSSEHPCVGTSDHTWRHFQGACSARKCS